MRQTLTGGLAWGSQDVAALVGKESWHSAEACVVEHEPVLADGAGDGALGGF